MCLLLKLDTIAHGALLKLGTIFWVFVRKEIYRGGDRIARGEIHRGRLDLGVPELHLNLDLLGLQPARVDVQPEGPAELDVGVRDELEVGALVLRAEAVEDDAGLVVVSQPVGSDHTVSAAD